jgi:asparagine synthase (glutamine-hydrolysing)
MCGIAGVFRRAPLPDSCGLASRLSESLAHRGPDDTGLHRDAGDRLLLVHRRLAIIDPSPAGRQPMATPDGRHWIVFNGEVYNFRALRAALEREGERFATNADTEVLLRLIVRRGPEALAEVRGMFALAVWDARAETLLVARDRFGIKPLYVAASSEGVAFASELRALGASGLVARDPDPAGVLGFLQWGSVPPPLTWVRGASALEPGTWRTWRASGEQSVGRFADIRDAWVSQPAATSAQALGEQTRAALVDSVTTHLVADVPVGVFLSGGVDSAALVSAAHAAGRRLHTYTVVVAEDAFSEAEEARLVAERFESVHHTLEVDARSVTRDWPVILRHLDQPTIDAVNTFYAARAVAETGVKAVLSGVGGDELFGGYPSFRRLPRALGLARALGPILPLAARVAAGSNRDGRAAKRRHIAAARTDPAEIYRGLRGFLMPDEVAHLAGPRLADDSAAAERVADAERSACRTVGGETPVATAARLETMVYMRHQLLRDVDVMSMAHGLEVRVPLVDDRLLAAVWPALGAHRSLIGGKRLLVEAAPHPIPAAVALAPKRGFTLPFESWLRGVLAEPIRSGLADLAADGWIRREAPAEIWRDWEEGRAHWSRPWGLGVLGRFLHDA